MVLGYGLLIQYLIFILAKAIMIPMLQAVKILELDPEKSI